MDAANGRCSGCGKIFSHHGLSLHYAKTNRTDCRAVFAASQPQYLLQPSLYEQALLTLMPSSTSSGHPDRSFGSGPPSGHDGTSSDSPTFLPLCTESTTIENVDDREHEFHRSVPYTKPTTAMNVNDASNSAGDQVDDQASDSADDQADDQSSDTMDNNDIPNTADMTDADVFEIIAQTQTRRFLGLESTAPNPEPEQTPSADSESPPEIPSNPVEASSSDAHPKVFVEHFPHGNPGAPINNTQGPSIYESNQDVLGGSVWAPFQSKSDWDFAYWAKMNGPSASSLTGLLAIPNVRPSFFFYIAFLNVV